jgi:polyhydroxyalkanoate synthesis regulator phasin
MLKKTTVQLMALGFVGAMASTAVAEDSSALIDALVRKGVLKDKEAQQIRAQIAKDSAAKESHGQIKLDSSVKELSLTGDVRLRYQYSDAKAQGNNKSTGPTVPNLLQSNGSTQDQQYQVRLRINADYKVSDDFFAGFGLRTTVGSREDNQPLGNAYHSDYLIGIHKAYLGWTPVSGVTLIGGKQENPFYSTDMTWDPDVFPAGFSERVDFHKFLNMGPLEVSLVGGQLIVSDANENNSGGRANNRDGWIFNTQLQVAAKVSNDIKVTVAPGYYTSNKGKSTLTGQQTNNIQLNHSSLESYEIYQMPGDVSVKVGSLPAKFYWDFSYNHAATAHSQDIYNGAINPTQADRMAYLAGISVGQNKKKGDFSARVDYRIVGLSAVDPNIIDNEWSSGYTNTQGWRVGLAYNIGDSATIGLSYLQAASLRREIGINGTKLGNGTRDPGGTTSSPITGASSIQLVQLDLGVKF